MDLICHCFILKNYFLSSDGPEKVLCDHDDPLSGDNFLAELNFCLEAFYSKMNQTRPFLICLCWNHWEVFMVNVSCSHTLFPKHLNKKTGKYLQS